MKGWFGSSRWSPLIDLYLQDIDNFRVQRTKIEVKSSWIKNRYNAIFTGFVRVRSAESAAIEVARTAEMLNPAKKSKVTVKLMNVMVEIPIALIAYVNHDQIVTGVLL